MTNQGPRKTVGSTNPAARLLQAREFHESARSLVTRGQSRSYNGAITLIVMAAIAYADATVMPMTILRLCPGRGVVKALPVQLRSWDPSRVIATLRGRDAGVRPGELLDRDMVAVRISGDHSSAVVAAPDYLRGPPPLVTPEDLAHHRCIGYRLVTAGTVYRWRFAQAGRRSTSASPMRSS